MEDKKDKKENLFLKEKGNNCYFCLSKTDPSYKDINKLQRHLNERGMIYPRQKTRLCASHQRKLSNAIKKARYLALIVVGGNKEF